MKIKLTGYVHREGISKNSGKAYDFFEIHFVAPSRGVIGEAALTAVIDPSLCPGGGFTPGVYDIQFDHKGVAVSLAPIQPVTKEVSKNG